MSTIQKQRIKLNMERMKKMHKDRMASMKNRLASMSDTKKEEKELVSTYLESKHKKDKEEDSEEFLLGKDPEKIERMRQQQSKVMELNKYTLAGYQQKAVGDVAFRAMDQGSGIKGVKTDANRAKLAKRMGGIAKAARKLSSGGYTGGVGPESPTGKMHNEDVDEGVLGAIGGGIVGGMLGGPAGALAGAYGGHKIQQQRNKIKKLQAKKGVSELNVRTMRSYRDKADDSLIDMGQDMKSATPKFRKRQQGMTRAFDKIQTKKIQQRQKMGVNEQQIDEFDMEEKDPKKHARSKQYHYDLGKKTAMAGKEKGETSDNYGPYASDYEAGYHSVGPNKFKPIRKEEMKNNNHKTLADYTADMLAQQFGEDNHAMGHDVKSKKRMDQAKKNIKDVDKVDDLSGVKEELSAAQKKLPAGLQKAIMKKKGKSMTEDMHKKKKKHDCASKVKSEEYVQVTVYLNNIQCLKMEQ